MPRRRRARHQRQRHQPERRQHRQRQGSPTACASVPISGGPIRKAVKAMSASVATLRSGRGAGSRPTIDMVSG